MSYLSCDDQHTILDLRLRGFAVVVFGPDELRGVDPCELQDILVARGNDHIKDYGDEEDEHDER